MRTLTRSGVMIKISQHWLRLHLFCCVEKARWAVSGRRGTRSGNKVHVFFFIVYARWCCNILLLSRNPWKLHKLLYIYIYINWGFKRRLIICAHSTRSVSSERRGNPAKAKNYTFFLVLWLYIILFFFKHKMQYAYIHDEFIFHIYIKENNLFSFFFLEVLFLCCCVRLILFASINYL